ncbi:MAG TPA: SDR family NAD(P)-dependent oxidoreductase [Fimbriimonas sp.]|nr:SDR family NAD(P)-dependent oxidoreductase [Fimbriimonas sp.]
MDPLSLDGRVALITGAASGIGLAVARALGAHGCRIGLLDLDEHTVRTATESLKGVEVEQLVADVTDPGHMESAVEQLAKRFGRIDIVHANAGINGVWARIEDITPEEFDQTIATNLKGSFLTIKYAVPFLKREGGAILLTSSVNGTRVFSNSGATPYSCSKAGQVAMAKMLAVELGPFGIRVNVICPGYVPSNIHKGTIWKSDKSIRIPVHYPQGPTPLTSESTPEQVGDLALFLVSDMAKHITGEVVYIDAGTSLVVG